MDDQGLVANDKRYQLDQVASSIWSGKQVTNRVVIEAHPPDRVFIRVGDVVVGNVVATRRRVDVTPNKCNTTITMRREAPPAPPSQPGQNDPVEHLECDCPTEKRP